MKKENLIFVLIILTGIITIQTVYAADTSILATSLNISNFTFASSTYVPLTIQPFNTTKPQTNFTLLFVSNVQKVSGGGSDTIKIKILVDNASIAEQEIARVTATDLLVGTFLPVNFNVSVGAHNLTVLVTGSSGTDTINISNIDMRFIEFISAHGNSIRNEVISNTFTHSSTNFISAFNFSVNKTISSATFFLIKQFITASASVTPLYYLQNLDIGNYSSAWGRYLQNGADAGGVSGQYIFNLSGTGQRNYTIQSQTDTGATVTSNITLLDFDLADNQSNVVNSFEVHNTSTNLTSSISLSGGTYNIVNASVVLHNGTGYYLAGFVDIKSSSGTQTPRVFINSTNISSQPCFTQKERKLVTNADQSTVHLSTICSNLTVNNNYTINMWLQVPSGETITLLDEDLQGFEVTNMNLSAPAYIPPFPGEITTPLDGDNERGVINVTWNAFDDPDGDVITYNLSLFNPDYSFNQTINSSTLLTSQLFNTSTMSDGYWIIGVIGCDNQSLCSNDTTNFTIDNTPPIASFSCNPQSAYAGDIITCTCTPSDALSGINPYATSYTAKPSTVNVGTFMPSCSFADLAGNNGIVFTTYSVAAPLIGGTTPSSSGGGGVIMVGIGNASNQIINSIQTPSISPNQPAEIAINNSQVDLTKIEISVTTMIPNISLNITKINASSIGGLPAGQDYQAFQINTNVNNSNISNATIQFRVNKTFLEEQNATVSDIGLYRIESNSTEWTALKTTFISEDNYYYYFSSVTSGFSIFCVFIKQQPSYQSLINNFSGLIQDLISIIKLYYFWIALGIVVIIILILMIFFAKKIKRKQRKIKTISRNERLKMEQADLRKLRKKLKNEKGKLREIEEQKRREEKQKRIKRIRKERKISLEKEIKKHAREAKKELTEVKREIKTKK